MVKDAGLNCKKCVKAKIPDAVPLNELRATSYLDPQSAMQPIVRREVERLSRNANQGSDMQRIIPGRQLQLEAYPDFPEMYKVKGRKGNY